MSNLQRLTTAVPFDFDPSTSENVFTTAAGVAENTALLRADVMLSIAQGFTQAIASQCAPDESEIAFAANFLVMAARALQRSARQASPH